METESSIYNPLQGLRPPGGAELLQLRMRHGLTQSAAGQLVGINGNAWSRYECSGRRMPVALWACLLLSLDAHPYLVATRRSPVL